MDDFAELEISLISLGSTRGQIQMRYRPPNSQSEIRLGLPGDLTEAPVLDLPDLSNLDIGSNFYAEAITAALFSNRGLAYSFSESLAAAAASNSNLRVRLWIDSPSSALNDICWELLLNPKDGTRLSTGERIFFSRGLSTQTAAPLTLKPPEDATALLAVANPADLIDYKLSAIDTGLVLSRGQTALFGLGGIRSLPDGRGALATLDNLFLALTPDVDILYLACHGTIAGNEAWLWLENNDGKTRRVSATEFVNRMRGLPAFPKLVILASCQSAGSVSGGKAWMALGPRLVNAGIPAVIAMQGDLSQESEAIFMPRFFQALQEHGEADHAMSFARTFIANRPDWWAPALLSHLRDNRILGQRNPLGAPSIQHLAYEPETVYIPAGSFWMGTDEPQAPNYERPYHLVSLPAFRIGKYPVTNRNYAEFNRQTKRIVKPETGWIGQNPPEDQLDYPVQGVTWYDAMEYCNWLGKVTGRRYRLPSEAEWEKSARGDDGRRYPWGNTWDPARCSGMNNIRSVDAFPPQSKYGCHDMVGNIREWTLSLWGQNRLEPDPEYLYPWSNNGRNDISASKLIRRVVRGAGTNDKPELMTCYSRNAYIPDNPGPPGKRHGFRVLMEI